MANLYLQPSQQVIYSRTPIVYNFKNCDRTSIYYFNFYISGTTDFVNPYSTIKRIPDKNNSFVFDCSEFVRNYLLTNIKYDQNNLCYFQGEMFVFNGETLVDVITSDISIGTLGYTLYVPTTTTTTTLAPTTTTTTTTFVPFTMTVNILSYKTISVYNVTGYTHDYTIYWGDDSYDVVNGTMVTGNTHTYSTTGTKTIVISGICESLWLIPPQTFFKIVSWGAPNFKYIKMGSSALGGSLPADTYGAFRYMTSFSEAFYATTTGTKLTSISADLFKYATGVTSFYRTFDYQYYLTIPSGLFDNCINVTTFDRCFFNNYRNLTTIPTGLFDNCTNVLSFEYTFSKCSNITNIPTDLFRYNTLVTNFTGIFNDCAALSGIPSTIFDYNSNANNFSNAFSYCGSLTGNAPTLWVTFPEATGTSCFSNDSTLDNWYSIPEDWGGPAPTTTTTTLAPTTTTTTLAPTTTTTTT